MIKQFCYISKSKWFKDFIRCPRYSIEVQNNNGQKFIDKYNKKKPRDNNNLHDKITNKVRFKFILLNNNGQK